MSNRNEVKKRICECGAEYTGKETGCSACKKSYEKLGGGGRVKKNLFAGRRPIERQHAGNTKDYDLIREGSDPIAGDSLAILEQWLQNPKTI